MSELPPPPWVPTSWIINPVERRRVRMERATDSARYIAGVAALGALLLIVANLGEVLEFTETAITGLMVTGKGNR